MTSNGFLDAASLSKSAICRNNVCHVLPIAPLSRNMRTMTGHLSVCTHRLQSEIRGMAPIGLHIKKEYKD